MTIALPSKVRPPRSVRMITTLCNLVVGTLLAATPVTALLALGWAMRRQGWRIRSRFGLVEEAPGWLLGPRESGRTARLFGGLSQNIRSGLLSLCAALPWTLPFTSLWLGAWWAGWENSFNKGYEQAAVGPSVFLFGIAVSMLVLPLVPLMTAHVAAEDRLSAAFELRRLRAVAALAGWRIVALAVLAAALATPIMAARGLIAMAPTAFPGIEDLSVQEVADLKANIALALAMWVFLAMIAMREAAGRVYAQAAPAAASRQPGLWDGTLAAEVAGPRSGKKRWLFGLWYGLAAFVYGGFGGLVLVGQFLDHAFWRWINHPLFLLPWAG